MGAPFGEGGEGGYTGGTGGGNPAWQEFLEAVPQEYHEKVTPVLEKWDKGVNERFEKVQSDYAPWKSIIQNGHDPETTQFALNLLSQINEDPKMVYDAIGNHFGLTAKEVKDVIAGQGQGEPNSGREGDPYDARFAAIEQQNQTMARILLKQREAEEAAREDAKLDQELSQLRKTHGDFDESWVLSKMHFHKMSAQDAVKNFLEWKQQQLAPHLPKPLLISGGGPLPSTNTDPRKLNDSQTKDYVVGLLQAAAAEKNR